jgi:MFS family permease
MQTMAEAWLVVTLTGSGVAVGTTFACRFAPVFLFGLVGGSIADRFDRRRVLIVTNTLAAILAIALWLVVWTGVVHVWMVFALAVALGFVTVFDEPARHAFVEEMVGRDHVPNAVALNSAVANSARITGPALAGILIATLGTSWVFFMNALSFVAYVVALLVMRKGELRTGHRAGERPSIREGLSYAWSLTEIRTTILVVAVVGTLVYNFPTFLTLLARDDFHGGAGLAGLLMAILGVGTVVGALTAASRAHPTRRAVLTAALFLGVSLIVAAALPQRFAVELALVPVGALAVFFGSTASAHMQISSARHLRGRVMAIYTSLTLGVTVIGGPFVGWVCQRWSPRTAIGLAGVATASAAVLLGSPLARRLRAPRRVATAPSAAAVPATLTD